MIEPIMYLAIGFLISMLFGLMIVPLVHNRAVRLTTKRMEAATPLSMAEIQADKDQLRAEFAMSARRLEMSVDKLKHQTTSQLAELGKKSDAINRLKMELGEKNAAIAEGKRAMMLLPESRDALDGPKMTLALAQIYAWTGENDAALELLERSLMTQAGVTVSSLKLNPIWDPLRSDVRFQALIEIPQKPDVELSMNRG